MEYCTKVNDHLYVVKWDPKNYKSQHNIAVTITDAVGRTRTVNQQFSIDGDTDRKFSGMARFILMSEMTTIFMVPFWLAVVLCVVPLTLLKLWHWMVSSELYLLNNCSNMFLF